MVQGKGRRDLRECVWVKNKKWEKKKERLIGVIGVMMSAKRECTVLVLDLY